MAERSHTPKSHQYGCLLCLSVELNESKKEEEEEDPSFTMIWATAYVKTVIESYEIHVIRLHFSGLGQCSIMNTSINFTEVVKDKHNNIQGGDASIQSARRSPLWRQCNSSEWNILLLRSLAKSLRVTALVRFLRMRPSSCYTSSNMPNSCIGTDQSRLQWNTDELATKAERW